MMFMPEFPRFDTKFKPLIMFMNDQGFSVYKSFNCIFMAWFDRITLGTMLMLITLWLLYLETKPLLLVAVERWSIVAQMIISSSFTQTTAALVCLVSIYKFGNSHFSYISLLCNGEGHIC